jgi:putative addiction module CopG family antidote
MEIKELPAELAHFVQQELANGTYQSAEALVVEAVRMLKERRLRRQALQQRQEGTMDAPPQTPQTPDEYVRAIAHALETGDPVRARTLAREGAEHYPQHTELHTCAQVLAPPTGKTVPSTPESRAALKANNIWLKAHGEAYCGNWIALQAGQLLHASPSFDDVVAHVGDVRGRGILLTKIFA